MPWMPNASDIQRGFAKLKQLNRIDPAQGLRLRQSSEKFGYYLIDGVRHFEVSEKARTSGSIGRGRLHELRKKLHLSLSDFRRLCDCTMSGPEYHDLMRGRPSD